MEVLKVIGSLTTHLSMKKSSNERGKTNGGKVNDC